MIQLWSDGWEEAYAYHWMYSYALRGLHTIVLPQSLTREGHVVGCVVSPFADPALGLLTDIRPQVRAKGFVLMALGATRSYEDERTRGDI